MRENPRSLAVGLGLPVGAILVVLPLIADTSVYVLGIPLLWLWLFAWFPLTTLCLWIAWRIDEPRYRDAESEGAAAQGEEHEAQQEHQQHHRGGVKGT